MGHLKLKIETIFSYRDRGVNSESILSFYEPGAWHNWFLLSITKRSDASLPRSRSILWRAFWSMFLTFCETQHIVDEQRCKRNHEPWPIIPLPGTSCILKSSPRTGSENWLLMTISFIAKRQYAHSHFSTQCFNNGCLIAIDSHGDGDVFLLHFWCLPSKKHWEEEKRTKKIS